MTRSMRQRIDRLEAQAQETAAGDAGQPDPETALAGWLRDWPEYLLAPAEPRWDIEIGETRLVRDPYPSGWHIEPTRVAEIKATCRALGRRLAAGELTEDEVLGMLPAEADWGIPAAHLWHAGLTDADRARLLREKGIGAND